MWSSTEEETESENEEPPKLFKDVTPTELFRMRVTPGYLRMPESGILDITLRFPRYHQDMEVVIVNCNSLFFELVNPRGTKDSFSQTYCLMSKYDGTWNFQIKMRDLKKIPPLIRGDFYTSDVTIIHAPPLDREFSYPFKDSKIIRFQEKGKRDWGIKHFTMILGNEQLEELRRKCEAKYLEEKEKKKNGEKENEKCYGQWNYKEEWDAKLPEYEIRLKRDNEERGARKRQQFYKEMKKKKAEEDRKKEEEDRRKEEELMRQIMKEEKEAKEKKEKEEEEERQMKTAKSENDTRRLLGIPPEPPEKPKTPRAEKLVRMPPERIKEKKKKNPCCSIV